MSTTPYANPQAYSRSGAPIDSGSAGRYARIVLVVALVVLAYWGTICTQLIGRWSTDGNWSHGFLIPVFSLYFLWMHREKLAACRVRPSYLGAFVLAMSLGMYFFSTWILRMGYPATLSIVGTIFGVTLLLAGREVMRVAWFPILFLVLAVPLPSRVYVAATMPLRELSSAAAAAIMPLFISGLHTEAQAVVIDYMRVGHEPGTLNVEQACSGMRLMMAFVTLGVAITYLRDRPLWQRLVMVASCLPIAILCNIVRVTITGLLFVTGHDDWAEDTPHAILGIMMQFLALGLFSALAWVLANLFVAVEESEAPKAALSRKGGS